MKKNCGLAPGQLLVQPVSGPGAPSLGDVNAAVRLLQKLQQLTVDFVRMGPGYRVRPIFYHQKAGSLNQLGGPDSRSSDRQNPVRIAVNDQRWDVDAGQVFAEVFMPGWHARKTGRGRGAGSDVPAGLDGLFADALAEQD